MTLLKRDHNDLELDRWLASIPLGSSMLVDVLDNDQFIVVDEFREDGVLVVRAELPGIDPHDDVQVTVRDGLLTIRAERREEEKSEGKDFLRHELRYGTFARTIAVPAGVTAADVRATYKNGILEVRVPEPAHTDDGAGTVEVTTE